MSLRPGLRRAAFAFVVLASSWVTPAAAQDPAGNQREADERFQEGKALLAQGQVAAACLKLEQSLALLRRGGTLLNLAVCRETEGRYATALRLFQAALDMAITDKRADREKLARERIPVVREKLSWIEVKLDEGADVPDLVITCDGEPVPRGSWGAPMSFDTGDHRVVVSAARRAPIELSVKLSAPGERQTVRVPVLSPIEPPAPSATASAGPAAPSVTAASSALPVSVITSATASAAPAPAGMPGAWRRPVGIAALATGVAAVGLGVAFGVKAIVDNDATLELCPDNRCPTDEGITRNADARAAALVADVALPVGVVAAGLGVFLLATSRSGAASPPERAGARRPSPRVSLAPAVGPGGGGLWLRGAF